MSQNRKTIAFFGASGGVGLSAVKHTLSAGHHCVALCRVPSKLTSIFPPSTTPNLTIIQGNAHDVEAVSSCLKTRNGTKLVDGIVSTIGGKPTLSWQMIDDPNVCEKGMATLLEALATLRRQGVAGKPFVVVCSTTGISRFARDVPLAMVSLYHVMLKVPHKDKKAMEDALVASGEEFTIVRASLLMGGETEVSIRVGIEDVETGVESKAIGYTISREDAGRWFAENVVMSRDRKYVNKIATITY